MNTLSARHNVSLSPLCLTGIGGLLCGGAFLHLCARGHHRSSNGTDFASVTTPTLQLSRRRVTRLNLSDSSGTGTGAGTGGIIHRYTEGPERCRLCQGYGTQECGVCDGKGVLKRGGFARHNPVRVAGLVGTKWTSVTAIQGKWRHFLCVAKKGKNAKDGVAILSSTCGPVQNRVRFDVPVRELKARDAWQAGWTTMSDIRANGGGDGKRCAACKGECVVMCPRCEGLGQVGL